MTGLLVDLPGLAQLAYGLLVLLGGIAVAWLIRGIGSLIGHVGVSPFKINLGGIFSGIASSVESWAVRHGAHFFTGIANWFTQEAYSIKTTFEHALKSDLHIANQVDHLAHTVVPGEVHRALQQAQGHTRAASRATERDIHDAWKTWNHAHTRRDAQSYIRAQEHHPSVEHALLALAGAGVLQGEDYVTARDHALRDYIDRELAKQRTKTASLENTVSVALPAEIAGVRTAVKAITSEFERCAVTRCKGPNQFGNLLQDALGVASGVEIAAFVAEAIKQPQQAGQTFAGQAEGLYHGATNLLDSLLSM